MRINNYYLQFFTALLFMLGANLVFAQDQVIPLGTGVKNYAVDTSGPNGSTQPDGTPNSTYTWTIEPVTGTVIGTFPSTGAYNAIDTDNKATIDWSQSTPGDYRVKVVESNLSCEPEEVFFTVRIETVSASGNVNWANVNICSGGDVVFDVTNLVPNTQLYYTLQNATITQGNVVVDSNGNATITATHNDSTTNTVIVTLDRLVLNGTDLVFTTPNPTATANINIIVTSPIVALD